MLNYLILFVFLVIVFGALYLVFKATTRIRKQVTGNGIGKCIGSFPVSYKLNCYVIKVGETYYLCNNLGGMIAARYDKKFENFNENLNFQEALSEEFGKLKDMDIKKLISRYKNISDDNKDDDKIK